ncbi:MAG TPA: glycine cleavage system protein GcvH [Firmicutes bacterium]|jgi:glycine cleavage system H protein|nr:glycine cleavage system protein GcvH [Bacillota bacterium]
MGGIPLIPGDLKYTQDHVWIRVKGDQAFVGITDYAQSKLGDIVFADLPAVGEKIKYRAQLGQIEAINKVTQLYSPVSGEILEVNDELQFSPELLNQDPYGKGWIALIELAKPEESHSLLTAEDYRKLIDGSS